MSDAGPVPDDDDTPQAAPDEERPVGSYPGDQPDPGPLTERAEADQADAIEQARDVPPDEDEW